MLLREMVWGKDYNPVQPRDEAGRWGAVRWECLRAKALAGVEWQKYDPAQERAPAGAAGGGRWVATGGGFGAVGGSPTVAATSNSLTERARGSIEMLFPDWATFGVDEVRLIEGSGREFDAGGNHYKEGGHWDASSGTIRVFDQTDTSFAVEDFEETVGHEVGHSLFDEWWRGAREQEKRFEDKYERMYDAWGIVKPEHREERDKLFKKECPLSKAQQDFIDAWGKKEDGITEYSKSWAKDGVFCETVAEMSKLYFTSHGKFLSSNERWKIAEENVRQVAAASGAKHLASAFNSAMRYFRAAQKRGTVKRRSPLVVATQPSFTKATGKTIRKFFTREGVETTPDKAAYAVELVLDGEGGLKSSTRYVVQSLLGKSFEGHDA